VNLNFGPPIRGVCAGDKKRVHRVSLRSGVRQNSADGSASAVDWWEPTAIGRVLEAKRFERGDGRNALFVDRHGHLPAPAIARVDVTDLRCEQGKSPIMRLGAVGELTGWAFDARGQVLKAGTNRRLTSIPHPVPATALTVAVAVGPAKVPAIQAALNGRLINGLITDEATATALLAR